jgi:hypothetical protein
LTVEQVYEDEDIPRGWLAGWTRENTKIELWSATMLMLWAVHLLRTQTVTAGDPVAVAMYQLAHVPMPRLAVCMAAWSMLQYASAYYHWIIPRRIGLMGAVMFWVFVDLSFWRFASAYPGSLVCLANIFFIFVQFLYLSRRRA